MLDLDKQIQKLKELLKGRGMTEKFTITPESSFLKVNRKNGYSCYYTLDLKHSTVWERYKSITRKNGLVKLTRENGTIIYLTPELEYLEEV